MLLRETGRPSHSFFYPADEARIWTYDWRGSFDTKLETFTLRDLDGRALSEFQVRGTGSIQWTWDTIYRGTHLLAADTAESGARSQQHYSLDHLGSPRLTTGTQGQLLATHHYFGFGEEIAPELHPDPEKHRFTGHERDFSDFDRSYDLDYMHARYCSPQLGRFLSVDPARRSARPSAPQTWNRYAYARNNPLYFVDPDGRIEKPSDLASLGAYTGAGDRAESREFLATVVNLTPGLGDVQDAIGLISGHEPVSGNQLSGFERLAAGVGAAIPYVSGKFVAKFLSSLKPGRSAGVQTVGSADELNTLYEQLSRGGKRIEDPSYSGEIIELPDGTRVGRRSDSKSGGPTIDVKLPDGTLRKVHVR